MFELCIISKELLEYVESLTIDKDRLFTRFRPTSKKQRTYSDHYSLKMNFKNIPLKPAKPVGGRKLIRWNTKKDGDWEAYNKMAANNDNLMNIANDETEEDPDIIVNKIENVMTDIKYQAFVNVKDKSNNKV